jgi:hypothetical protein
MIYIINKYIIHVHQFDRSIEFIKSIKNYYITMLINFYYLIGAYKIHFIDTFVMIHTVYIETHSFHLARVILYCLMYDNYGLIEQWSCDEIEFESLSPWKMSGNLF